jgi:hypothetical protein
VIKSFGLGDTYQVFYRTNSTGDKADGTVATVFTPNTPSVPPKIFSYQAPEDATNLNCANSWALTANGGSNNTNIRPLAQAVIDDALKRGFYVVASDFEGSKAAWLAGVTEGRACLDAIRATIKQFALPSDTGIALYGYSGGAHATVWASTLAAVYASELQIKGAAYGGTPVDLVAAFNSLNNGDYALLAAAALFGLANGYPALDKYFVSKYTDSGRANATLFRTQGYCTGNQISDGKGKDYTAMFTTNIFAATTPSQVFANESLLSKTTRSRYPVPNFPRYMYHSQTDEVVPFAPAQQYVDSQCGRGANLAFQAFSSGEHALLGLNPAVLWDALDFTSRALSGSLPPFACGDDWH